MTKREWKMVQEADSPIGAWHLEAATCPLWPHEDALGRKRSHCLNGLITNGQGPVPISWCKFCKQGLTDEPIIECSFVPSPSGGR